MQPHVNNIKQEAAALLTEAGCHRDGVRMRWDRLFADLEGQLVAAGTAELEAEVADRARAEHGRIRFVDRLRAADGQPVQARVVGAGVIGGTLCAVGVDWLLVGASAGGQVLVRLAAVVSVSGLGTATAAALDRGLVYERLDFRRAVRALALGRSQVRVRLVEGGALVGTLDRVGADFVELAEHPAGEPRRPAAVRAVHAVPIRALAAVQQLDA